MEDDICAALVSAVRRTGEASMSWGRYDPNPLPRSFRFARPVYVLPSTGRVRRDPLSDFIDGAEWWFARSDRTAKALQRAFDNEEVACCLLERVGAILPMGKDDDGNHVIAIQIARTGKDWDVDLCLSEIGIYLDEIWLEEKNVGYGNYTGTSSKRIENPDAPSMGEGTGPGTGAGDERECTEGDHHAEYCSSETDRDEADRDETYDGSSEAGSDYAYQGRAA